MLKRHSQFFKSLMVANDMFFLSVAWWLAFGVRFHSGLIVLTEGYVVRHYVLAWIVILCTWSLVFSLLDLYRPRRISSHLRETADIFKGSGLAILLFLAVIFLLHDIVLSRLVVVFFWVASVAFLNLSHVIYREALRFLRRRGYNLRHVLVIGAPAQVNRLIHKLQWHRHLGFRIVGLYIIGDSDTGSESRQVDLLKSPREVLELVRSGSIDQVFITFPLDQSSKLHEIPSWLEDEPVTIHFVPDLGEFEKVRGAVEDFDGMHIITLQASPLYGWNALLKRAMDVILGGLALIVFSPLMVLIALAIKVFSPGPVLYRQERMGLDGERFEMLKFRTMVQGAEQFTGPVWAADNDPRVTPLGRWLRSLSLDELPQLINVLRGEMSLVGPRPERPLLIEEFRKSVPKYMLRHKIKAGMTGWAQVNGWRGNTSLERRIEHDLEYIENWSLWRDVKILARTLRVGFRNSKVNNL